MGVGSCLPCKLSMHLSYLIVCFPPYQNDLTVRQQNQKKIIIWRQHPPKRQSFVILFLIFSLWSHFLLPFPDCSVTRSSPKLRVEQTSVGAKVANSLHGNGVRGVGGSDLPCRIYLCLRRLRPSQWPSSLRLLQWVLPRSVFTFMCSFL